MRKSEISAIYSITNIRNNKIYIGSAFQYKNRRNSHLYLLRKEKHHNKHLQKSFIKYGEKNFQFGIIEYVENKERLIEREQVWIDFFKPEYNICTIAGSSLGFKFTQETKLIQSEQRSGINNPNFGKPVSEERKKKFRETRMRNKEINFVAYKEGKKYKMKAVVQMNLNGIPIKEFESIRDAGRYIKTINPKATRNPISWCCNGMQKFAYGFKWKFKEIT